MPILGGWIEARVGGNSMPSVEMFDSNSAEIVEPPGALPEYERFGVPVTVASGM